MRRQVNLISVVLIATLFSGDRGFGQTRTFPTGQHGAGELRYIDGVPVLTLQGSPQEMGDQFGQLAVKGAPDLNGLLSRFLEDHKQTSRYPLLALLALKLKGNLPSHLVEELAAVAKAGEFEEAKVVFANMLADLTSGLGCSTLVVEPGRSQTGGPLLGRNFDWLPTRGLTEHTLVAIYRGTGKRAFAAVTITPITGVISGMNDAGLSVTLNEIQLRHVRDRSQFNWKGLPLMSLFRQVLEECTTVAEAEKLIQGTPRTTSCCMTICDRNGGAVLEITPSRVELRPPVNGIDCCTNHFRSAGLGSDASCWRYAKLCPLEKTNQLLGVAEVFHCLDQVHQGKNTLQSMVFEPRERVLHLKYGDGPATRLKAVRLALGPLFDAR